MDSYGNIINTPLKNDDERVLEELSILGWSRLEQVFSWETTEALKTKLGALYRKQEAEFGRESLLKCKEHNQVRCITRYDETFFQVAKHPRILAIIKAVLGDFFTLMLQNAVILQPDTANHQSSWHRDLPYQNFVCDQALAVNALVVLDEFNSETGGTELLPHSHQLGTIPSEAFVEKHKVICSANPGDVIIFNSMLLHRAGQNNSSALRHSLNNQFAKPFIKPQYRLDDCVPKEFAKSDLDKMLLGMTSSVARDDLDWREKRLKRFED